MKGSNLFFSGLTKDKRLFPQFEQIEFSIEINNVLNFNDSIILLSKSNISEANY
jgi:hypothetical protein